MINTMKRAHEIRRQAAAKWGCSPAEIIWSECLKMAHAGDDIPRNEERGVEMKGSEKQVAWAESIKAEAQGYLKGLCSDAAQAFDQMGATARDQQLVLSMYEVVDAIDDAKWWIDNRHKVRGLSEVFDMRSGRSRATGPIGGPAHKRFRGIVNILPKAERDSFLAAAAK